ncbi:MAG: hypothetical protein FDZ75_03075 [Actinobacteria bacterium]|nr:MAG: hypothetical protein FDZ75_03075 [Actinomycetota bacterium]
MYPDDDVLPHDQEQAGKNLQYDNGVFYETGSRRVDTSGAPDDFVEEPWEPGDDPGTIDDIPYTMGVETPAPADQLLNVEGPTRLAGHPAKEETERPEGAADERRLWERQKPLIQEDEDDGLKLEGFGEEVIPAILDAMGDDAAEPLPDFPNGTSATGSVNEPDHGGFPERE